MLFAISIPNSTGFISSFLDLIGCGFSISARKDDRCFSNNTYVYKE